MLVPLLSFKTLPPVSCYFKTRIIYYFFLDLCLFPRDLCSLPPSPGTLPTLLPRLLRPLCVRMYKEREEAVRQEVITSLVTCVKGCETGKSPVIDTGKKRKAGEMEVEGEADE